MALHETSGRARLGFALALTTMSLWAILPLALKGVLGVLDPFTITWARFVASLLVLGGVLAARGDLPPFTVASAATGVSGARIPPALLLGVATTFLAINYGTYLVGLHWTTAADAQVLIQLGPILLSLGGIVVFRERFTRLQWLGLGVLLGGLGVFLAARLGGELRFERLEGGMAMIAVAAITWAVYGLAQKQLLQTWSSQHVLLVVYAGCALLFAPLSTPSALTTLDGSSAAVLAFCALNTVVGYGAFAESLEHWEASRVGAVLALTPIGTLVLAALLEAALPQWGVGENLSALGWTGALLVVVGSLGVSLGARSG